MLQRLNAAADAIEQVAKRNGMGVRVVSGRVLPQAVEFHIQPSDDYDFNTHKTIPAARVGQFIALQNDLALRLGADSLRISQRGANILVQMPRKDVTVVMADRLLRAVHSKPSSVALLGIGDDGEILTLDFANPVSCHALIAGTTGSGKTQLAHTMIYTLCKGARASEVGVVCINPKGDAVTPLIGNNLLTPVATEPETAHQLLLRMVDTMERRKVGTTPRIILQVDEVADLIDTCRESLGLLTRLAQRGREVGIHLLLATQRPDAKAMGALLRANLPARLIGRVLSAEESRMASGYPQLGAERLNGNGDFIFVRAGNTTRFQAALPPETRYAEPVLPQIAAPVVQSRQVSTVDLFAADCIGNGGSVSGKDLYAAYLSYCESNGFTDTLDNTKFGNKVKSMYPEAWTHTRNGSLYTGIGLR